MKLVPFVLTNQKRSLFLLTRCSLFLAHAGKRLWQTEEEGLVSLQQLKEEYLHPNGFVIQDIQIDPKKQIAFIQVNASQMNFQDFYMWEEALTNPEKPECWRPFYFVNDADGVEWWSAQGIPEAEFQGGETLYELFQEIRLRFSDT